MSAFARPLVFAPLSLSGLRAEIMRVAAGMAPRVAEVDGLTRVRATLTGRPELRPYAGLFGEALALGLSGIAAVPTADVAPVAGGNVGSPGTTHEMRNSTTSRVSPEGGAGQRKQTAWDRQI